MFTLLKSFCVQCFSPVVVFARCFLGISQSPHALAAFSIGTPVFANLVAGGGKEVFLIGDIFGLLLIYACVVHSSETCLEWGGG